jgi:hypothetical protein
VGIVIPLQGRCCLAVEGELVLDYYLTKLEERSKYKILEFGYLPTLSGPCSGCQLRTAVNYLRLLLSRSLTPVVLDFPGDSGKYSSGTGTTSELRIQLSSPIILLLHYSFRYMRERALREMLRGLQLVR